MKIFLLIFFISFTCHSCRDFNNKSSIKIVEPFFNFGVLSIKDSIKHGFVVINSSSKVNLKIVNINSECGCTNAGVSKKEIKPGDSAIIQVTFHSQSVGEVKKGVIIEANTDSVYHILYLKGKVISN